MVNGKELAQAGFKYLGRSYEEMDCQAFVERCLKDCGNSTDLGGSNSWYREVGKNGWVGTPEECVKIYGSVPKGTFLFILEPVSASTPEKFRNDGIGDATHIGLVTGQGEGAIHSSSSKGGVCESKFSGKTIKNGGWNRVGLWDQVDYGVDFIPDSGTDDDPEPDPAKEMYVVAENGKPVNLRVKPNTKAALVDQIPVGEVVTLLKQNGSGWAYIQWKKKKGWMMETFLTEDVPAPEPEPEPADPGDDDPSEDDYSPVGEEMTVWAENGKPVKLRAKPSTKCNLYDEVPVGATVTLVKPGETWCQVDYGTRKGWYMMTKFLGAG